MNRSHVVSLSHAHLFARVALAAAFFAALTACSIGPALAPTAEGAATPSSAATAEAEGGGEAAAANRPAGWTDPTHGDATAPNYAVVFPQEAVNTLTITIDPADYAAMQADMTELFGAAGEGGFGGGPGGGGGPGAGGDFTTANPIWVTATITFNGLTWTNVGVRYKGNSSLASAWRSGSQSLPLKLDFDELEDDYPEIDNQRFYGFKQLSLSNNFGDATYMRETLAYDLLAAAGLPAAETAFYEIILDYGDGPVSLGLYTAVEVIDDTVVEKVFGSDEGNIYEADGAGVSLALGTQGQIESSFQKENNEDTADWSDIEALYAALHSDLRTTDPAAWRAELEAVFNVDGFLEWLALSALLQHWDTYGGMSHNFYLYNDPATGQLQWISWDHNFILGASAGGDGIGGGPRGDGAPDGPPDGGGFGGPGGGRGGFGATSLDKAEVGDNWPLIRFLLDDAVYGADYAAYLDELAATVFEADTLAAQYQAWAALLAPYVDAQGGRAAFEQAVQTLTDMTYARETAVAEFLAGQAQ